MPPMPAEAEAPPDLLTPRDRAPGLLGAARHRLERADVGQLAVDQVEIGEVLRQQRRVGEAGILVLGRDARHRHRPLGQRGDAVAAHVVGRDHRLLAPDQHAKTHVVALGALRFLDRAVAHVDRLRHRAHRHGIGGIGAGRAGSLDQPLGERDQLGLVEQGIHCGLSGLGGVHGSDKASNRAQSGWIRGRYRKLHHPRQRAVNHALQATRRLTRPLKPIPTALRHDRGMTGHISPAGKVSRRQHGESTAPGSSRALRLDPYALPVRYAARDSGADGQVRDIELDRERVVLRREVRGIPMKIGVPCDRIRRRHDAHTAARGRGAGRRRRHARASRQRAHRAAVRRDRRRRRHGAMEILGPRARRAAARGRRRRRAPRTVPPDRPSRAWVSPRRGGGAAPPSSGGGRRS